MATAKLMFRLPRRQLSSKLSPAAMDAAIAEMNAEMSDLFGSEMGDVNPSSSISSNDWPPSPPPHRQPPQVSPLQPSPSSAALIPEVAGAKSALLQTISTAASDLSSASFDVERCSKLASCIAECANAVSALDKL